MLRELQFFAAEDAEIAEERLIFKMRINSACSSLSAADEFDITRKR